MASRKIEDLIPSLRKKAMLFAARMAEEGIPFMFTCTLRTQAEQDELYAQGRTKSGPKVTWTRNSRHIGGRAFDIAILKNGRPTWDIKVSVNGNNEPDYKEAGRIGEEVGLEWGGRWKTPDMPHFQLKE